MHQEADNSHKFICISYHTFEMQFLTFHLKHPLVYYVSLNIVRQYYNYKPIYQYTIFNSVYFYCLSIQY